MTSSTGAAPAQTKIFGIRIGVDPKILAGILIALALILIWYNTRSDDEAPPPSTAIRHDTADVPAAPVRPSAVARPRRNENVNDRGLRLRPIDPTRGDVDPTLRLDLLARLANVQPAGPTRSLFEVGPPPLTPAQEALLKHPPVVPVKAPTPPPAPLLSPADQPLNVPLKYYGFVKSEGTPSNQGLFLDTSDNIVLGREGEMVMKRYLIVALTPTTARLQDPQSKKDQTLLVIPAATP